jgi:TonB family protein
MLSALLLAVVIAAPVVATGRAAAVEGEDGVTFAEAAEALKRNAETAFAQEQWDDAVVAYGRLIGHLFDGGYAEGGGTVAACRLQIAVAFMNKGELLAAQTMLVHLAEAAPEYETARVHALLAGVRAALGIWQEPVSPLPVEEPRVKGPIRVGADVTRPELISSFKPEYTREARRARIQGVVIVEVVIDAAGNVTDAKVLKPLPMGLDRMAIEAPDERQHPFRDRGTHRRGQERRRPEGSTLFSKLQPAAG